MHWPFFSNKGIVVFRFCLHNLELILEMSRQVTMMGVLDVLSREHSVWLIVLVQLLGSLHDVVLHTIAVSVVDSVGTSFPLRIKLQVVIRNQFFIIFFKLNESDSGRRNVSQLLGKGSCVLTSGVTVSSIIVINVNWFLEMSSSSVYLIVPVDWLLDKLASFLVPREYLLLVGSIIECAPLLWLLVHVVHLQLSLIDESRMS